MTIILITAVLGWANPERDKENLRLYATDLAAAPRHDGPAGRVIEQAIREAGEDYEGDRYLVIRLGDRFLRNDDAAAAATATAHLLTALPLRDVRDAEPVTLPPDSPLA